jgi:hypothetical protein
VALLDDQAIAARVETIWAKVFQNSNTVLKHAKDYGFLGMELIPSPNIHQIMLHLTVFDALIDILLANQEVVDLGYEQARQLLNAKSQLVNMEKLASALKANNQVDYDAAIAALEGQLVI